jgi:hypothetical protein
VDGELSRIAAGVLQRDEQLLWAGKPLDSGPFALPQYFKLVFSGFLLFPLLIFALSTDRDPSTLIINLVPILIVFGLISIVFLKLRAKYANPKHNTFLVTQRRAVHVFSHDQITNVASVPLDRNTSVRLLAGLSGTGDLQIKRKSNANESDNGAGLFALHRSAWVGMRFSSVPQAAYVRDVANWAIAQNDHRAA